MSIASDEIDKHCARLAKMMVPPRGWTKDQLLEGYAESLEEFSHQVVGRVVDRIVKGGYERKEVNPDWAPTPPALAALVRAAMPSVREGSGRHFTSPRPRSQILEVGITRDEAKRLVDNRMYPAGCIWCPGDPDEPRYGMLFAPDPDWRGPQRVRSQEELKAAHEQEARELREAHREKRARRATSQDLQRLGDAITAAVREPPSSQRPRLDGKIPDRNTARSGRDGDQDK